MTLLAACSSGTPSSGTSGKPSGTVTVWTREANKGFMSAFVDLYNKGHDVQASLTIIPEVTFVQKLGTVVASGSGPDVATIDLDYAPYFASTGALKDSTTLTNSLSYKSSLSPSHMRLGNYNGK